MRFLVDECAGPAVAEWLRGRGHEVFSVFDEAKGIPDNEILTKAVAEERILITNDKDFWRDDLSGTPTAPRRSILATRRCTIGEQDRGFKAFA